MASSEVEAMVFYCWAAEEVADLSTEVVVELLRLSMVVEVVVAGKPKQAALALVAQSVVQEVQALLIFVVPLVLEAGEVPQEQQVPLCLAEIA